MSEEFDPYRKWLGIAPHEQPVHHYRLLGIAPFEDDPDVIENAADRQMAHVRTYQGGRHRDQSQKILNELASAKGVLLDSARKPAYDAWLQAALYALEAPAPQAELPPAPLLAPPPPAPPPPRREQGAPPLPVGSLPMGQAVPPGTSPPIPMGSPVPAVTSGAKPRSTARARARKKGSPVAVIVGCVVAGLALVGAMVVILQNSAQVETPKNGSSSTARKSDKTEAPKKSLPASKTDPTPNSVVTTPLAPNKTVGIEPQSADLPREKRFEMAAIEARLAFGQRNLEQAKTAIDNAEFIQETEQDTAEVERLRALYKYLDDFWSAVRDGIYKRTEPGDALQFDGDELELINREGELITIKQGQKEQTYKIVELPAVAASLFARKAFDTQKDARPRLCLAAFWALDAKAIARPDARARAERWWKEAAERGRIDQALAQEMGLDEAFISSVKPLAPDEPLPKLPSLEKPDDAKVDK